MFWRKLLLLAASAATALSVAATAGAATSVTTTATFTVTSRTLLGPPRFAGGNVFVDRMACGTASLANGGSWNFCQTVTLVLHPDGTFNADGDGTLTGVFPGCSDASRATSSTHREPSTPTAASPALNTSNRPTARRAATASA